MKQAHCVEEPVDISTTEPETRDQLTLRHLAKVTDSSPPLVVVGELIALTDHGRTPLVIYPGQKNSAGVAARSTIDLAGSQIGQDVLLLFETGGDTEPIVVGVFRKASRLPAIDEAQTVEVQADGDRVTVSAKKRLVLCCGKASITLTQEGKILIEGTYVSSRSSGLQRIKGGAVQIN
jgi:hypothetical protein